MRKGIAVAGVTLATLMAARGAEAAPPSLAGTTAAATTTAGGAAAGPLACAIARAALATMSWAKLKFAAVVIAMAVAGGAAIMLIATRPARAARGEPARPANQLRNPEAAGADQRVERLVSSGRTEARRPAVCVTRVSVAKAPKSMETLGLRPAAANPRMGP